MSWFDGVAMFALALERAGMECVGACEIDAFARRVRAVRLGAPGFYPKDINDVLPGDVPQSDLWIGGSPCQDFSVAGMRAGIEGTRSGLVLTWLALANVCRPEWIIIENVPGLLSGKDGEDEDDQDADRAVGGDDAGESAGDAVSWFGTLLGALADAGYRDVAWRILDARWWGVAQRRRRVFVVAHLGDGSRAAEVLFEPESVRGNPATRGQARARTAGRAADGAGTGRLDLAAAIARSAGHHGRSSPRGDGSDNLIAYALRASDGRRSGHPRQDGTDNVVVGALQASDGKSQMCGAQAVAAGHDVPGRAVFVKRGRRSAGPNGEGETWGEDGPAPTLNANDNTGDSRATVLAQSAPLAFNWQAAGSAAMLGFSSTHTTALGRTQTPAVLPVPWGTDSDRERERALTASSQRYDLETENFAIHDGVRRLTPGECEALQALPRGWTCLCGSYGSAEGYSTQRCACADGPRYRAIGNGGVVNVVEWIGRRLLAVHLA